MQGWWSASLVSGLRLLGSLLAFGLTIVASQVLGPEGAGRFFVTIAWAFTLSIVARWGSTTLLILDVAPLASPWRRPAATAYLSRSLRSSLWRLALILALVAPVFFIGPKYAGTSDFGISPFFLLLLAPLLLLLQQLSAAAKALDRPVAATIFEFCFVPFATILFAAIYFAGASTSIALPYFEGAYLFASAGAVAIFALVALRVTPFARPLSPRLLGASKRRATHFALIEIASYLSFWVTLLVMPFLLSNADTGIFNAALRIASLVSLVYVSAQAVFMPHLSRAQRSSDWAAFGASHKAMWAMMATSALGLWLGIVLLGRPALSLFGPAFVAGYVPLLILGTGFCLSLALGPAGSCLIVLGHERTVSRVTIHAAWLTLAFALPAMYFYGTIGAAAVTSFSAVAQRSILLWRFNRVRQFGAAAPSLPKEIGQTPLEVRRKI